MIVRPLLLAGLIALVPSLKTDGCTDPDTDFDGLSNSEDNCDDIYNPAQVDSDQDGVGDACDKTNAGTPADLGGCFFSQWPPLRGVNWEDRPTLIEQGDIDASQIYVSIDWTASDSDWIERGDGTVSGSDVWYEIKDEHNPYYWTKTIVEGSGVDTNNDGRIDEFHGTYLMFKCDSPSVPCSENTTPTYEYWTDGNWDAALVNSLECNRL